MMSYVSDTTWIQSQTNTDADDSPEKDAIGKIYRRPSKPLEKHVSAGKMSTDVTQSTR